MQFQRTPLVDVADPLNTILSAVVATTPVDNDALYITVIVPVDLLTEAYDTPDT